MTAISYNYPRFDEYVASGLERAEFGAFPNLLHAGARAPDASLVRLDDGVRVSLLDLCRRQRLVLEFGSFT